MKRLLRVLLKLLLFSMAMSAIGLAVGRIVKGDTTEQDDDFRLFAFWNGWEWKSTSGSLTSGKAMAVLGGVDLDLTGAAVSAAGATLSLTAAMGGIRVVLPASWRVDVEQSVTGGGVEVNLAGQDALPADAPHLAIDAMARAGGILITNE
jgi:hypothetical protein